MIGLLTPSTLASLLRLLGTVSHLDGAIAELGIYQGATLKAMAEAVPEKQCYGFDTFAGIPAESWQRGDHHQPGEFAASYDEVAAAMPHNVTLIRGIFPHSAALLQETFCFAHIDMDVERSTEDAIEWLRPRMVKDGVVVFDDWKWKNCPGVARAIDRAGLVTQRSAPHQVYWTAGA